MHNHKKLDVWKHGHELTLLIHSTTASFPISERFGLTNQMRRAAISIPCNLAEGGSRDSPKEFIRFVEIAHGSALELEYQLQLATELGYVGPEACEPAKRLTLQVVRELYNLRRALSRAIVP